MCEGNKIVLSCFIIHYAYRSLYYPSTIRSKNGVQCWTAFTAFLFASLFCFSFFFFFLFFFFFCFLYFKIAKLRNKKKQMCVFFVCVFFFCVCVCTVVNGSMQGLTHTRYYEYEISKNEMFSFRFIFGILLWFFGFMIVMHSDHILTNLRKNDNNNTNENNNSMKQYKIPFGGFFRFVSCPNYLGEFIEWLGYAIAGNSAAGYAFCFFTFANLYPRALETHKWYLKTFNKSYPKNRTPFFPFLG